MHLLARRVTLACGAMLFSAIAAGARVRLLVGDYLGITSSDALRQLTPAVPAEMAIQMALERAGSETVPAPEAAPEFPFHIERQVGSHFGIGLGAVIAASDRQPGKIDQGAELVIGCLGQDAPGQ